MIDFFNYTVHFEPVEISKKHALTERYTEHTAFHDDWIGKPVGTDGVPTRWQRVNQKNVTFNVKKIWLGYELNSKKHCKSDTFIECLAADCFFEFFGLDTSYELWIEIRQNERDAAKNSFKISIEQTEEGLVKFNLKLYIPHVLFENIYRSIKDKDLQVLRIVLNVSNVPGLYEDSEGGLYLKFLYPNTPVQSLPMETKLDYLDDNTKNTFFDDDIEELTAMEGKYSPNEYSIEARLGAISHHIEVLYTSINSAREAITRELRSQKN